MFFTPAFAVGEGEQFINDVSDEFLDLTLSLLRGAASFHIFRNGDFSCPHRSSSPE